MMPEGLVSPGGILIVSVVSRLIASVADNPGRQPMMMPSSVDPKA